MSDSDDSDFGAMRADVRTKMQRATPLVNRQNHNDGNDGSSDDDVELIGASSSKNKRQKISVDQRLAKFDHKRKIQQRNRQNLLKARKEDSSSDDDDSEDEKPSVIPKETRPPLSATPQSSPHRSSPAMPPSGGSRRSARLQSKQGGTKPNAARPRPPQLPKPLPSQAATKRPLHEDIIELSSDEETTSVSTENNEQLKKLRQARDKLLAQQPDIDPSEECEVIDAIESPRNQILKIVVKAAVDRSGKALEECGSISFDLPADEKFAVLEQSLLQELKLPADSSTMCYLTCGSSKLDRNRTAAYYDLESPCQVDAKIYITGWGKSKSSPSAAQKYGKSLQLILRKGESKTTVSYGLNQPFKKLIDDHGVLQFDGERVSPTATPASYDMESEDLIDIL